MNSEPTPGEATVIVMRHGVAMPAGAGGDRERTLAPGAEAAVREVAGRLAGHLPSGALDAVLLSPARRTRETAAVAAAALGDPPLTELPALYEAGADEVIEALADALGRAGAGAVLLVGHNPSVSAAAQAMTGGAFGRAMRPGDAVVIGWDRAARRGRLVAHVRAERAAAG